MKTNNYLKVVAVFCCLFQVVALEAQQNSISGGFGHFYTGITWLDYGGLNDYLSKQQLYPFQHNALMMGGGGAGIINNLLIGGEGGLIASSPTLSSAGEANVSAGYGRVEIGYVFALQPRFIVYPKIGMGWGGSEVEISYSNGKEEEYSSSGFYLSTELNLDMFSHFSADQSDVYGFKTGLSVGYLFQPQAMPWKDENGSSAPFGNTFFDGFYLKITIGGGAMEKGL
jgi:hypothetical protein